MQGPATTAIPHQTNEGTMTLAHGLLADEGLPRSLEIAAGLQVESALGAIAGLQATDPLRYGRCQQAVRQVLFDQFTIDRLGFELARNRVRQLDAAELKDHATFRRSTLGRRYTAAMLAIQADVVPAAQKACIAYMNRELAARLTQMAMGGPPAGKNDKAGQRPADIPGHIADLLAAAHLMEQFEAGYDSGFREFEQQVTAAVPELMADQVKPAINAMRTDIPMLAEAHRPTIAKVISARLSVDEIKQLTTYFRTPAGEHYARAARNIAASDELLYADTAHLHRREIEAAIKTSLAVDQ